MAPSHYAMHHCSRPFFFSLLLAVACLAQAQGIPPAEWTEQEHQFVTNARALYTQQGLTYSDEQAAAAVQQMRARQQAQNPPALKGIPEAQWSPQEREFVQAMRAQYAQNNRTLGQEEAQVAVEGMRNQMARLFGSVSAIKSMPQIAAAAPALASAAPAAQPASQQTTEAQLAATLASWPPKPASFVLNGRKDGFELNGEPVIDPEGQIISVAGDPVSGAVTYIVRGAQGVSIKAMSAAEPGRTQVIATGMQSASSWALTTTTGQRLGGQTLSVQSDGFLVGRDTAAFHYRTGRGVANIAIPEGWFITPWQRGDLGSTGYMLLEKEAATGGNSDAGKLFSSLRSIAAIVGAVRKEDYALFDIAQRKLVPLNMSANGKNVLLHSQCRKRNHFVNECAKAESFEALYSPDGFKNDAHYYWRVQWINTPAGPLAFTLEDGQGKLYVTDLRTGRKVVALERALGVADWEVLQRDDGTVGLKGRLGLEWREVPDVIALLQEPPPAAPADPPTATVQEAVSQPAESAH